MSGARFETKPGSDSGASYERWLFYEERPSTPVEGKEDVYVAHHRLLAVVGATRPRRRPGRSSQQL